MVRITRSQKVKPWAKNSRSSCAAMLSEVLQLNLSKCFDFMKTPRQQFGDDYLDLIILLPVTQMQIVARENLRGESYQVV